MSTKTILVVDDEPKLVAIVRAYLERDGYKVIEARTGREALALFRNSQPDMVLLDLSLPEVDGLEVCKRLRRATQVPIIMLTARADEADELIGLDLGADDYVTKPFSPRTLVARVHAVFRRLAPIDTAGGAPVVAGLLQIDTVQHAATWGGTSLSLTPTEFQLLLVLARRPGRVFARAELLDRVQGEDYAGYDRTVDAHIKNLRRKLEAVEGSTAAAAIVTVPGVGYKLEVVHA